MFTTVAVNIASSTVNIDIAVTRPYQHHQSTLHHVSFKAKSTIINMTMSKMNYIYSNKKNLSPKIFSWDESIVKVPPRLDMQVWDADSFSKVSFLHSLRPQGVPLYFCWSLNYCMCCARMTSLVLSQFSAVQYSSMCDLVLFTDTFNFLCSFIILVQGRLPGLDHDGLDEVPPRSSNLQVV